LVFTQSAIGSAWRKESKTRFRTIMAAKKASFITGIVCVIMLGLGWLSDPLTAAGATGALAKLLAWSCLAAGGIALIAAIYFTFKSLATREPPKESDFEFEGDDSGDPTPPNS
jgi:sulfite exporter TauE/SafE